MAHDNERQAVAVIPLESVGAVKMTGLNEYKKAALTASAAAA